MRKQIELPILEKTRTRVKEIRGKLKTRIEEFKSGRPATQKERFPKVKEIRDEIREKGLVPTLRTRTMRARRQVKRHKARGELTVPRELTQTPAKERYEAPVRKGTHY